MLFIKPGVHLTDLCPQMVLASYVVDGVYADFGIKECWITSANDSKHSERSWHYKGRACDYRTHQQELNGREQALRDEVKRRLTNEYDVVLEAVGTDNEHLHVEYDPK